MKVSPYVAEVPSTKDKEDRPDPLQRKGSVKGGNNIPYQFNTPSHTISDTLSSYLIITRFHTHFFTLYTPFPTYLRPLSLLLTHL